MGQRGEDLLEYSYGSLRTSTQIKLLNSAEATDGFTTHTQRLYLDLKMSFPTHPRISVG